MFQDKGLAAEHRSDGEKTISISNDG
uniref:Uncharacterized protein n=1 Tax=Moniliophthora roreri TaxID=221103 RepID=A0A0W0FR79_MONRR